MQTGNIQKDISKASSRGYHIQQLNMITLREQLFLDVKLRKVSRVRREITLSGNMFSQEVFSMACKVCLILTTGEDKVQ